MFALSLGLQLAGAAALGAASPSDDRPAIDAVVAQFRAAIIAKDGAALNALRLNDRITFAAAIDPATLARIRTKRPTASRIQVGSYDAFVTEITTARTSDEEKFSNVIVHSDGAIATVYFDYVFEEDHVATNWGHESWGLLRTDDGWKISSILYSITLPEPPIAK